MNEDQAARLLHTLDSIQSALWETNVILRQFTTVISPNLQAPYLRVGDATADLIEALGSEK